MSTLIRQVKFVGGITLLLTFSLALAQETAPDADRTLSPYFFVQSDDPEADQLPLKAVSASVDIAGVIADVTIRQTYQNDGEKTLEAIYIFPASTRAAIYGMQMKIGERTITAEIREREEAREEYEEAREEGKSASLLEQERPNVFQMNVANILPGDTIQVELRYTELLVPTEGIYEFVYPTVVGPRYSNSSAGDEFVETPYFHEGESPAYTFDIGVHLAAGLPLQEVMCRSHEVDIAYEGDSLARISLGEEEEYGGNRDFILQYRLAGDRIESGLLLYRGEEENFFLLMAQPPKRVELSAVPPREYIFIVDVSGSMRGFPLDISKELLRDLIGSLRVDDYFNVLLFAGGSTVMSDESLPATEENVTRAIETIDRLRGGGGTELLSALRRALSLPRPAAGNARTFVIATDGYVTVEVETFDFIREHLHEANMFAFGIGSDVNRFLIEGMARAGMGEPFVVIQEEEARDKVAQFRQYIETPVLTQIEMDMGDFASYDIEPLRVPDVLAERPLIVFGKWEGKPQGQIELRGSTGDGVYTTEVDVGSVEPLEENAALRYLWARHRIALLGDYNGLQYGIDDELVGEITRLGLTYNLLTAYTSFVAIDQVVRADGGDVTTVEQPLPLPQGVSDWAVGPVVPGAFGPPPTLSVSLSAGDFDGDGALDFNDFFYFADHFGTTDPLCDLNGDGIVDLDDFFLFADSFTAGM